LHSSPLSAGHANMPFRTETPGPKRTQSELSSSFRNFSNVPGNAKASAKNSRHPQPSLTRSTGLGKHLSGTWKHGQGGCVVTCHICEFEQTEWDSIRPACACLLGNDSWDARECSEWTATCIVECASSHLAPSSPLPSRIQFQRSTSTLFPSLHSSCLSKISLASECPSIFCGVLLRIFY
jgi:hypothetical protein